MSDDGYSNVGHDAPAEMVGEIMAFGRTLFYWEDLGSTKSYINLDHVTIVNWVDDERLELKCGEDTAWTTNPDTIARFWAEWEII